MATVAALKALGDTAISTLNTEIDAAAPAYKTANGYYPQMIGWCAAIPDDGVVENTDTSRKPSDRDEDWTDLVLTVPATTKIQACIDSYISPGGHGLATRVMFTKAGKIYYKGSNRFGDQTHKTHDWLSEDI